MKGGVGSKYLTLRMQGFFNPQGGIVHQLFK